MDSQNVKILDFSKQFQKRRDDVKFCLRANKAVILQAIQRLKASDVKVNYCGSGDSGAVEGVEIYRNENKISTKISVKILAKRSQWNEATSSWDESMEQKALPIEEALREFVYDWLEIEHPGWENNDGASGELTIDVSDGKFILSHTSYYTEHDYSETSL